MTPAYTRSPEKFVERFAALWVAPTPDGFLQLLHEDGSVYWPGMPGTLQGREVPAFVSKLQGIMPDIRIDVQRCSATGDVLFIEWILSGTLAGQSVRIPGVDRFVLKDGTGIEMRAFFDSRDILIQIGLDPGVSMLDAMSA